MHFWSFSSYRKQVAAPISTVASPSKPTDRKRRAYSERSSTVKAVYDVFVLRKHVLLAKSFWRLISLPLELICYDLEEVLVLSDGNCLYRAFAGSLLEDENKHLEVRNIVVEIVRANMNHFRAFYVPNNENEPAMIETALTEMETPNTWGSSYSLAAAAIGYQRNIAVFISGNLDLWSISRWSANLPDLQWN